MSRLGGKAFLIAISIILGLSGAALAGGWFITVSGSGYSTPDSVGTGYEVSLGGGYMLNDYLSIGASVGFAQYVIKVENEDGDKEELNVYEIPISLGVRADLSPRAPIDPFIEAGPMAYLTKVEGEDWTNSWGAYAGGGLAFHIGSGSIEVWIRYSISDFEDTSDYRLTYGLGGSFAGR